MKKVLYSIAAISALMFASCAKETANEPANNTKEVTIQVALDDETKTAYVGEKTFKWLANDTFKVIVYKNDSSEAIDQYQFTIQEEGTNVTAKGTISEDYPETGYALYPFTSKSGNLTGTKDAFKVNLPANYTVATGKEMSIIPLIGIKSGSAYNFKTATGILKVTLTNMPVAARKVVLKTSNTIAGLFPWNEDGFSIGASDVDSPSTDITINIAQQTAGSTYSVYFPVPAGSISAGASIEVQQTDGTVIKSTGATVRDIPITRNKITAIPAFSVEDWTSLGTGKFMDDDLFYATGYYGRTADDYIDVEIQQHSVETNRYRLVNPYQAYMTKTGKSAIEGAVGPNDYFYFTLESGYVINDSYRTGLNYYSDTYEVALDNPKWWGYANYWNNRVIKEDASGNPLNIQLSPLYFNNSTYAIINNASENPKIEIVFPGSTPMLPHNNYPNYATVNYNAGSVNATLGSSTISSISVVAASDLNTGVALLESGTADLTFTASGSQSFSSLTPDTTYRLVYRIETDGHGYTYKDGGSFTTPAAGQVALSTSNVTAVATCSFEGSLASAFDNDASTYWHSEYWYPVSGLDPVYGIHFTITLDTPLQNFHFEFITRNSNSNAAPTHIVYGVSNDGTTWTKIDEEDTGVTTSTGGGATITLKNLDAGAAYKYLRFGITNSTDNTAGSFTEETAEMQASGAYKKSVNLAELKLFAD